MSTIIVHLVEVLVKILDIVDMRDFAPEMLEALATVLISSPKEASARMVM